MQSYKIEPTAYAKAIFHAYKYPTQPINGLLIGQVENKVLHITDAIPLFHNTHTIFTSPLLEMALLHIDALKLPIAGYYFANELERDASVSALHKNIASKIASKSNSACCLWQIINSKLAVESLAQTEAIIVYKAQQQTEWIKTADDTVSFENLQRDTLKKHITQGSFSTLVDYEHTLEQPEKSFLNKDLEF